MENKEEKVKVVLLNQKPWIFFSLIVLTVIIPQIVAYLYTSEFVFGYPVGEEYKIIKAITAIVGVFLVYQYLQKFRLSKTLKILLATISLIPLTRLIVATALFFSNGSNGANTENIPKIKIWDRVKDIILVIIAYFAVYNIIFAVTGFVLPNESDQFLTNILRILIFGLFFYAIYRRKVYLDQTNLILSVLMTVVTVYLLF